MAPRAGGKDAVFVLLPGGNHFDPYNKFAKIQASSLAPSYIISYLKKYGFDAEQALLSKSLNFAEYARLILEKKPRVVGFTVYITNFSSSVLLSRALKALDASLLIVFGGPAPTVQSQKILEQIDCVDICARNEGEETMVELLTLLRGRHTANDLDFLSQIRGISYRIGDEIFRNDDRDVLFDKTASRDCLDAYPSPYLSGVLKDHKAGLITARGCNQNCTYCNCAILSRHAVRFHSVDRVVEELDCISRMSIPANDFVHIYDDAFTLEPGRAILICEKIIAGKIRLPLAATTRCDKIDSDLLDLMKEAGFKLLSFSLESATPRILRNIGKLQPPGTTLDPTFEKEKSFIEQFRKNALYALKIGLYIFPSIMVGLPGETPAEGQRTIDFIESLDFPGYVHNILSIFPSTQLASDHKRFGLGMHLSANKIDQITEHAYNPFSLKLAPRSNIERQLRAQQTPCARRLSLMSEEAPAGDFCNSCIYVGDDSAHDLVLWLRDTLSLNGHNIQISTNPASLKERYNEDLAGGLPSTINSYYTMKVHGDGVQCLQPFEYNLYGERCNIPLYLVNSKTWRSADEPSQDSLTPLNSVYLEGDETDARFFYDLLKDCTDFSRLPLPYFSSVCKWSPRIPNCELLETLIVDSEKNVKTCWRGQPIGKVGESLAALRRNLQRIKKEKTQARGCDSCRVKNTCVKCPFPDPLEEIEYCNLRRAPGVEEGALMISNLTLLKELVR